MEEDEPQVGFDTHKVHDSKMFMQILQNGYSRYWAAGPGDVDRISADKALWGIRTRRWA